MSTSQTDPQHFIEFLLQHNALQLGDFILKSGRRSPYFINLAALQTGAGAMQLGAFYAKLLQSHQTDYDMLYGPAYKGIPLVSTTAMALQANHQQNRPYCFNRKEPKQYGDQGHFVGAPPKGRIVMLDDVITAGTTLRETIHLLQPYDAQLVGVVIAFDREDLGTSYHQSAAQEIAKEYGIFVQSLATLQDLLDYLKTHKLLETSRQSIEQYQSTLTSNGGSGNRRAD